MKPWMWILGLGGLFILVKKATVTASANTNIAPNVIGSGKDQMSARAVETAILKGTSDLATDQDIATYLYITRGDDREALVFKRFAPVKTLWTLQEIKSKGGLTNDAGVEAKLLALSSLLLGLISKAKMQPTPGDWMADEPAYTALISSLPPIVRTRLGVG